MIIIIFLCIANLLAGPGTEANTYEVKKVKEDIAVDGKADELSWSEAGMLTDFHFPWEEELPQPTTFRALWSDSALYLFYNVIDRDIVAPGTSSDKREVLPSDRVEIFFKSNGEMNPYYCLELDPKGRILDYEARFYRNFDLNWSWPKGHLKVASTLTADGYNVEARITLESLRDLLVLDENSLMEVGLFRGDFYTVNSRSNNVKWISWIIPNSEKPDFHIPSSFGVLRLMERRS